MHCKCRQRYVLKSSWAFWVSIIVLQLLCFHRREGLPCRGHRLPYVLVGVRRAEESSFILGGRQIYPRFQHGAVEASKRLSVAIRGGRPVGDRSFREEPCKH